MIYDDLGLPKPTGASDWLDSSCVAGLCVLFDYGPRIYLEMYPVYKISAITGKTTWEYRRHPRAEPPPDFSRDQFIPLVAGLWKQGFAHVVDREYMTGRDILSPANKGHVLRCQDKNASWFQNLWLKGEILYHAKFTPLAEPNQLIAMMMIAGPEYLRLWTKHNPLWRDSIHEYWWRDAGAWRQEQDFAFHMIQKIEGMIK